MKLSKSLLSAILIGITVQTTSSCKKETITADSKTAPGSKTNRPPTKQVTPPVACIACGLG